MFATRLRVFRCIAMRPVSACLMLVMTIGCYSAPPLGSEEASSTADALYTAVTSRRPELVDAVEKSLNKLQAEQQISPAAMTALQAIVDQARAGEWQAAAEELDQLIRNQPE
jgi:hypothetical protein